LFPAVPRIERDAAGVEVAPIPRRPFEPKRSICAPVEDAMRKGLNPDFPVIESEAAGVDEAIPTLPFWRMVKSDVPVDDATLNGLVEGFPCTLKENDDEVALIPVTVPSSMRLEVPRVVAPRNRAAYPNTPPVTPEPIIQRKP
jgi:hypothetical protein